jgi:hypothetical protein
MILTAAIVNEMRQIKITMGTLTLVHLIERKACIPLPLLSKFLR